MTDVGRKERILATESLSCISKGWQISPFLSQIFRRSAHQRLCLTSAGNLFFFFFCSCCAVPVNASHPYSVAGSYQLNVTACNLLGCESALATAIVQNPVLRNHFLVTTDDSYVLEGNNTGRQM